MNKHLVTLLIIALGALVGVLLLQGNSQTNNPDTSDNEVNVSPGERDAKELADYCLANGGNWLADYSECEYISEDICLANGGTFSECDSACRHQSEPGPCTMQCVPVCDLN